MKVELSESIHVDAPADAVLAVLHDVDAWASWSGVYTSSTVTSRKDGLPERAELRVAVGPLTDTQDATFTWATDYVIWRSGMSMQAKSVTSAFRLEPSGSGTHVTFQLVADTLIPLPKMVVRLASKATLRGATQDLKSRVERPS